MNRTQIREPYLEFSHRVKNCVGSKTGESERAKAGKHESTKAEFAGIFQPMKCRMQ